MKKLKGNVTVKLFDKDGNLVHEESKDNMITNAIYYALGQCITNKQNPTDSDAIFPIATVGLGGVLLFDGELEEDVENVRFPMDVHLVAHAGQNQNTDDVMRGSLNTSESGMTDSGYVNTWDFSTSQGNGTIKSVALTHNLMGSDPLCFVADRLVSAYTIGRYRSGNYINNYNAYIFYSDNSTQSVFSYIDNKITKLHCVSYDLKVSDPYYAIGYEELVNPLIQPVDDTNEVYDYNKYSFTQDFNGNLYAVKINRISTRDWVSGAYYDRWHYNYDNTEGNATVWIRKWKYEDGTYVEDGEEQAYTLTNVRARKYDESSNRMSFPSAVINEGYLWLIHADNLHVYKINLENTAQIYLYGPFNNETIGGIYPMKGGGVVTARALLIYPDGNFVSKRYCRFGHFNYMDDNLFTAGYTQTFDKNATYQYYPGNSSAQNSKLFPTAYLGSIMNLGQTITKTSATSMKIVYTLTDAEYDLSNEEDNG